MESASKSRILLLDQWCTAFFSHHAEPWSRTYNKLTIHQLVRSFWSTKSIFTL